MDTKQLLLQTKEYLDDIGKDHFITELLLLPLNAAKDFIYDTLIQFEPDRFLTSATFSPVADLNYYTLPSDMQTLEQVSLINPSDTTSTPVVYVPIDVRERNNDFGRWVCWTRGTKFYLKPSPSEDGTDNGTIDYISRLADATGNATDWGLPAGLNQMIAMKAAIIAAAAKGKANAPLQAQLDMQLQAHMRGARRAITRTGIKYSLTALRKPVRRGPRTW